MKIDLDPENLRTSMTLWRQAADFEIPIHDDFKLHLISQRGKILGNFVATASAWSTLLRGCSADGPDLVELNTLRTDVEDFKKWAEAGLIDLQRLAIDEAKEDAKRQTK